MLSESVQNIQNNIFFTNGKGQFGFLENLLSQIFVLWSPGLQTRLFSLRPPKLKLQWMENLFFLKSISNSIFNRWVGIIQTQDLGNSQTLQDGLRVKKNSFILKPHGGFIKLFDLNYWKPALCFNKMKRLKCQFFPQFGQNVLKNVKTKKKYQ